MEMMKSIANSAKVSLLPSPNSVLVVLAGDSGVGKTHLLNRSLFRFRFSQQFP